MQADMRVLRTSAEEIWIDTEPEALEAARRHLEMYKIGREVAIVDLTAERAILSLIGPRSVEIAGTAALPEHACEATSIAGVDCLAVGTDGGLDLIAKAADAEPACAMPCIGAGAVEVGPEAAEVAADRGRRAPLRRRDERRDDARRGRHRRARRQLHQGLLHRPGAGRPPPLQGPPQPPAARARAERPGCPPATSLRLGEKEVGRIGSACVSPARGPIALAIVRREAEPGAELAVGEDGVTARVVDLPFG